MLLFVASILQSLMLPGLLLLGRTRGIGLADRLLLAAPLSLFANYCIVITLVVFGLFTTATMRSLVLVEIVVLALTVLRATVRVSPVATTSSTITASGMLRLLLGIIVVIASLKYIGWSNQFGTAITDWDGVVSWSQWGQKLFHGELPQLGAWTYPQIIPSQYASILKIAGSAELHILPKLLPIALVALLALTTLRLSLLVPPNHFWRILLALPVYLYFTRITVNDDYLFSGGADIAISYFAVLAAYLFVLDGQLRERIDAAAAERIFVFAATIIASSLLIKQIGLVVATAFIILYFFHARHAGYGIRGTLTVLAVTIAIPLHWYAYVYAHNHSTVNTSIYTSLLSGELAQRILAAIDMLYTQFGTHLMLMVLGALVAPQTLILPMLLNLAIWMPLVSYDTRGLYPILPLLAYFWVSAFAIPTMLWRRVIPAPSCGWLSSQYAEFRQQLKKYRIACYCLPQYAEVALARVLNQSGGAVAVFVLSIGLFLVFKTQSLPGMDWALAQSRAAVMEYGGTPQMNRYLVEKLIPGIEENLKIATDYQLAQYLPSAGQHFTPIHALDLQYFAQAFADTNNSYILTTNMAKPEVVSYLNDAADHDVLTHMVTLNSYRLYKVNRPAGNCAIYKQLDPDERWGTCS